MRKLTHRIMGLRMRTVRTTSIWTKWLKTWVRFTQTSQKKIFTTFWWLTFAEGALVAWVKVVRPENTRESPKELGMRILPWLTFGLSLISVCPPQAQIRKRRACRQSVPSVWRDSKLSIDINLNVTILRSTLSAFVHGLWIQRAAQYVVLHILTMMSTPRLTEWNLFVPDLEAVDLKFTYASVYCL